MKNEVLLGTGDATGMFFHAPAGTALPATALTAPSADWKKVGDITSDGISFAKDVSTEDIKNWANVIKRTVLKDASSEVKAPIMDTTETTMKVIFGEDNVKTADGTINVNMSAAELPDQEAYLFLMKDGDDVMMLGTSKGQITSLGNVSFKPGEGIKWEVTIKGLEDGWQLLLGSKESA